MSSPTRVFDALEWIERELAELEARGLRRRLRVFDGARAGRGGNGRRAVDFASNDYLGLATDGRLVEAAKGATDRFGWGAGASPLVTGYGEAQAELERELARFEGTEAAVVFAS